VSSGVFFDVGFTLHAGFFGNFGNVLVDKSPELFISGDIFLNGSHLVAGYVFAEIAAIWAMRSEAGLAFMSEVYTLSYTMRQKNAHLIEKTASRRNLSCALVFLPNHLGFSDRQGHSFSEPPQMNLRNFRDVTPKSKDTQKNSNSD
jgi:hypothetical protein